MRDDRSRFSAEFRLQELEGAVQIIYGAVQQLESRVQNLEGTAQKDGAPKEVSTDDTEK